MTTDFECGRCRRHGKVPMRMGDYRHRWFRDKYGSDPDKLCQKCREELTDDLFSVPECGISGIAGGEQCRPNTTRDSREFDAGGHW